MLWAFVPIAVVVTLTPGAGTAVIIRSTIRGGWRSGLRTIAGNEVGVFAWALLSVLGISALVAASTVAFVALKLTGAGVLLWLGVQSLLNARRPDPLGPPAAHSSPRVRPRAFRDGVITSLANPKLAVFFVALFPQFVHHRDGVLGTTLLMAAVIVAFDLAWYTTLSLAVTRAKLLVTTSALGRWLERASGTVLIALGLRVALEQR